MINRFTYKGLTLVIGVIVAALIVFTLWIRQPSDVVPRTSKAKEIPALQMVKKNMIRNYVSGFEELLSGRNNPYLN